MKSISSGVIEVIPDAQNPQYEQTAPIKFTEGSYKRQPKASIAVSSIDFAKGNDIDFDVSVADIDIHGMNWHLKYSTKSVCRSIGATYIVY